MPWGGAAGQNIEHPHTLAILSSFVLFQMHFSFIGKVQFRWAMLSCDSSYYSGWDPYFGSYEHQLFILKKTKKHFILTSTVFLFLACLNSVQEELLYYPWLQRPQMLKVLC